MARHGFRIIQENSVATSDEGRMHSWTCNRQQGYLEIYQCIESFVKGVQNSICVQSSGAKSWHIPRPSQCVSMSSKAALLPRGVQNVQIQTRSRKYIAYDFLFRARLWSGSASQKRIWQNIPCLFVTCVSFILLRYWGGANASEHCS